MISLRVHDLFELVDVGTKNRTYCKNTAIDRTINIFRSLGSSIDRSLVILVKNYINS